MAPVRSLPATRATLQLISRLLKPTDLSLFVNQPTSSLQQSLRLEKVI
jgi:hypothetical protein